MGERKGFHYECSEFGFLIIEKEERKKTRENLSCL